MATICGAAAWTLTVHLAAQLACEYKQSLYLCGDNRFDPYLVARFTKAQQKSPEDALRRILIARVFTAYQLDELIHRLNLEEAFGVMIISGVCTAFFDQAMEVMGLRPFDETRLRSGLAMLEQYQILKRKESAGGCWASPG